MEAVVNLVIEGGTSAVRLVLFTLLPILVVMSALLSLLEKWGVMDFLARLLAMPLRLFGLPPLSAIAFLQLSFMSFAAPLPVLKIINNDSSVGRKEISAVFAGILVMSQANALYPLISYGLKPGITLATSLGAALIAALLARFFTGLFTRSATPIAEQVMVGAPLEDSVGENIDRTAVSKPENSEVSGAGSGTHTGSRHETQSIFATLMAGGREGVKMSMDALPIFIIAVVLVTGLQRAGAVELVSRWMAPALGSMGLGEGVVLPIITKFLAGGMAMTATVAELVESGLLSSLELNRIAGFIVHPLDLVGVGIYMAVGKRFAAAIGPAICGAAISIIIRGIIHLLIF